MDNSDKGANAASAEDRTLQQAALVPAGELAPPPTPVQSVREALIDAVAASLKRGELVELSSIEPVSAKRGFEVAPRRRLMTLVPDAAALPLAANEGDMHGVAESVAMKPEASLVQRTIAYVAKRIPEIIQARQRELTEKQVESLVDLYLAEGALAEARTEVAMDNARERARFVSEVAWLNSKQIAANAGHRASNVSVTGSRWKQQGRLFSVPWKGAELF
ncbi:MAG TPA: hypothetical protein VE224_04105, partial [Pseudolabrys sp.]|nr:hypothetical protein [Pseudolabrys sp.]